MAYSARGVNRMPSIVTGGHGQADSAISACYVGGSLPMVIIRE